jgi:hypothetical protein
MPGKIGRWAAALGLAALSACTSPAYTVPRDAYNLSIARLQLAQSEELPDDQIDRVNGTYKGIITLVEAHNPNCPPTMWGIIDVGDSTLVLDYTPAIIMTAAVQPDGTVHAQSGKTVLDGVLRHGRLNFTVRSPVCVSRYRFRYVI